MTTARLRSVISRAAVASVAVVLGLTLSACGSDDPPGASDAPPANSQSDKPASASDADDAGRPDHLSDFPLPDGYTVVTSGSNGGAWTAMLNVSAGWEEMKSFYEDELPRVGWAVGGDRPFAAKPGTEIDASKGDLEATVGVSSVDGKTSIVINVVKQG